MKKKIILLSLVILLITLVAGVVFFRSPSDPLEGAVFATATVQDLKETVSASGRVVPASEVQLGFESSGRVVLLVTNVGAHVNAGGLLASLSTTDVALDVQKAKAVVASASAQLNQTYAARLVQEVKLAELKKGARAEELTVKKSELASAQTTLLHLIERTPTDVLMSIYLGAQRAVNDDTDHFFANDQTDNPQLLFSSVHSGVTSQLPALRVQVNHVLQTVAADLELAHIQFVLIQEYLQQLSIAWDGVINWSSGVPVTATEISTEKTHLASARAAIQSGQEAIRTRTQAIESQQFVIERITNELAALQAPATAEQLSAQEAVIVQAQANVTMQKAILQQAQASLESTQSQFSKRVIRAPFSGIVTKQDLKVGEIVSMNTPLIRLISDAGYQVEVNIPEADIANLQPDQSASVRLDAYPGELFTAVVRFSDPAATMIEGVATYRTVFGFLSSDERFKSGLSADVDIVTAQKTQILTIPQRALTTQHEKSFVRILQDGELIEREVTTGIRADGLIEILLGLTEGEKVLVRSANTL